MPQHAARNGAKPKPPGGRRVSKTEVQRRLDHADRLLRDGKTRGEVVDSMVRAFGVSTRAVDSYIARVRERWVKESKDARETARAATLARLDRLSEKAERRGQFGAAVSAEKLRAQINGLMAPFEVKATVGTPAPAPEMTLEQAIEELEALSEVLEVARPLALKAAGGVH